MDAAELLVTVGGAVLVALTLWFFLGARHRSGSPTETVYACPMHPWISSREPSATCSLCDMPLVRRGGRGTA